MTATSPLADWYFRDNGFNSLWAMEKAHKPIVSMAIRLLRGEVNRVLDMGCGNGALLKKIAEGSRGVIPYGLDLCAKKISRARSLMPRYQRNFISGNVFYERDIARLDFCHDLILFMPGRFVEMKNKATGGLHDFLSRNARHILLYAYGDWLWKYGDLRSLSERAGFNLIEEWMERSACLAVVKKDARQCL